MSTEYPMLDVSTIPSLMWREDNFSGFFQISPSIADEILANHNYGRQRPINQRKAAEYMAYMKDSSFEPLTTTINFSLVDNKVVLTDGQHRLAALRDGGHTYNFLVLVTKKTPEQIYAVTDRGKPRSLGDSIRTHGTAERLGLSPTFANKAARGLRLILADYVVQSQIYVNETMLLDTLVKDYKAEAHRIYEMADHLQFARKITGQLPMSLLLTLYKTLDREMYAKIDEFIFGCCSGINLAHGDPRRHVYNMYTSTARGLYSIVKPLNRADEIGILLTSWHYWYNDELHKNAFKQATIKRILSSSPNVAGANVTYRTKFSAQQVKDD